MKDVSKEVNQALAHTFDNKLVSKLSNEDYKQYIQMCACLTLGTLIKNEGRQFVADFCQGALNAKGDLPIVQQVKKH